MYHIAEKQIRKKFFQDFNMPDKHVPVLIEHEENIKKHEAVIEYWINQIKLYESKIPDNRINVYKVNLCKEKLDVMLQKLDILKNNPNSNFLKIDKKLGIE